MRSPAAAALVVVGIFLSVTTIDAFSPVMSRSPFQVFQIHNNPLVSSSSRLFSEEGGSSSSEENPVPPTPESAAPRAPPTPKQKRLDPMIASLTRVDPNAPDAPTKNLPLLGEVPVDGSLVVLVPAAVIAVAGFVLSIVIGFSSSDKIVNSLNQVVDDIAVQANEKVNRQYDENTCRGLCSSQEQDLEGLKSFMESLRKN